MLCAFKDLPSILEEEGAIKEEKTDWIEYTNKVVDTLLGDDLQLIVNILLYTFRRGYLKRRSQG